MNRIVVLLVLVLAGCSASTSKKNSKPEWVMYKPVDGSYYSGVGYANKFSAANYLQDAKKSALDDLISEISVNISSTSVLFKIDTGDEFYEEYQTDIKTTAKNEIEEYEIVGSWEDKESYWVYYRLSKQRYAQIMAEKARNARTLALDNFDRGNKALERNDRGEAMKNFINGFYNIVPYLNQTNKVTYKGEEIVLGNAIYSAIQQTLNEIEVTVTPATVSTPRILKSDLIGKVQVREKATGEKLANLPLIAGFTVGDGHVNVEALSDQDGNAVVTIASLTGKDAVQKIFISPDAHQMIEGEAKDNKIMKSLINNLIIPQAEMILKVETPTIFLNVNETIFGQRNSSQSVAAKLRSKLTVAGFDFTSDKRRADLFLSVDVNTQKGKESGSIYVAHLNLNMEVVDQKTKTAVYNFNIDKLAGKSLSYERASNDAYNKLMEKLEKEIIQNLVKGVLE